MSFTLVLNSANAYGSQNNTFKYDFIQGNFNIPPDSEVMVANAQIPYSFYNITSAYNNNAFTLSFPTASATYTTFNITIPDGFYTTTSLNYYIQQFCISNGLYLINSTGQNVYYISIQYNSYQYGNQILAFAVPTSLPAGHTAPSNWIGYPTVSRTPYITIASSGSGSKIGTFLGFSGGDYPSLGGGAVITANLSRSLNASPTISGTMTGYTTGQSLVFSGGGGSGAVGTIIATSGVITGISLTNAGTGYSSPPTVSVSGVGSGAVLTFTLQPGGVGSLTIVSGGSNYLFAPPLTFSGGAGSGASATAVLTNGVITGYTNLVAGSGYTSSPSVSIAVGCCANYSRNSDITPVGSTVNSIILRCSLVNNKVGSPMDILDSFAIANTNFGANINYAPSVNIWVKLSSGSFSNFMLTICDQNLQMINSLDNNILITLLFRFGTPKLLKE